MENAELLNLINQVLENSGLNRITSLPDGLNLRNDLGLDSFHLAELTVRIEDVTGIDVFSDGIVDVVGDIRAKLQK
jgi:acyl carrier protein